MQKLRSIRGLMLVCLLAAGRLPAQPVYYNGSSPTTTLNTLDSVATNGTGQTTLITATGVDGNKLNRCTALAVDGLNGRLFVLDGAANSLWSVSLSGSGPALVKSGLTNFVTDLALDVLDEQIYYTTSSTLQSSNTVQRMDYTGSNNVTLFTATGGGGVLRCTAIALDIPHAKIFIADAGTNKIWSMSLTGGGLTALATTTNAVPTDVAVDVTNQLVYFTASSPVLNSNRIERVGYNGSGLTTLFTAAGGVRRCTALDLDAAHATIYLSDAGSNAPALWRVPLAGGSATSLLSGLPATAKKVRYYGGPATRPPPALTGISLSGGNVVLNATNGYVGGTYYVLTSTNVATPLSQWLPVFTNVLGASGKFSLTTTNGFTAQSRQQFYILQVH